MSSAPANSPKRVNDVNQSSVDFTNNPPHKELRFICTKTGSQGYSLSTLNANLKYNPNFHIRDVKLVIN